jgi:hypothetical protein
MLNLNVITHNSKHLLNSYHNDDNGNEGKLKTQVEIYFFWQHWGKIV